MKLQNQNPAVSNEGSILKLAGKRSGGGVRMKKPLPIGVDNFKKMIKDDYYYMMMLGSNKAHLAP